MHSQYSSNQASISAHQLAGTSEERRFSDMASEEAFKKSLQVNTFSSESESRRRLSSILNKNLSGVGGIVTPAPAAAASITAPIISFSKSLTATTSSNPKLLTEASDPSSSSSTGIKGGLVVAAESPKLNATTASITTSAQADTIKAFKTIIKASAIMNSPTNMENAARKAAFYDQIIAGAEASESTGAGVRRVVGGGGADEDDAQKLMWATERAVRAAERAARAKEAEENEKIRDGEDSLLLYKKQLGSTPKMASSTSTTTKIDQPSSSKASKSSSPNIAISVTPDSPSSINTEPSRKTSKATSKLKTLMHNLVIPTMAQHLEDTKDIQGFEFNENMAVSSTIRRCFQGIVNPSHSS